MPFADLLPHLTLSLLIHAAAVLLGLVVVLAVGSRFGTVPVVRRFIASGAQTDKGVTERRAYPIHIYVGLNGDGKTITAVADTLPTLEAGRPVLSTVRLLDYNDPRPCEDWESGVESWEQQPDQTWRPVLVRVPCQDLAHGTEGHRQAHPLYVRFTQWAQLLDWRFGDVLMDEVTGVADAQDWAAIPQAVLVKLPQLRRAECALRITALSFSNCNRRIRQAAQAVTRCEGRLKAAVDSAFGRGRIYRPRRLVLHATYDAKTLPQDEISATAFANAKVVSRSRLYIPDHRARLAYDTYASVDVVGTASDAGLCVRCGGTRRRPECSCDDYRVSKATAKAAQSAPLPVLECAGH